MSHVMTQKFHPRVPSQVVGTCILCMHMKFVPNQVLENMLQMFGVFFCCIGVQSNLDHVTLLNRAP